ncbi:MAG: ribosome maturation factor RimP [Nannocystaceae bacterium]
MRATQNTAAAKVQVPVGDQATVLVEDALAETVGLFGYEIVLAEWAGGHGGQGRILRIYLDHADGVTLDGCTKMSRVIGDALDAAEADPESGAVAALLSAPYTLEVSSPGIERPLVKRSHFARFVGHKAVVKTDRPLLESSNQRTFRGVITAADEDPSHPGDDRHGIIALRDSDTAEERLLPLAVIRRANLIYEG